MEKHPLPDSFYSSEELDMLLQHLKEEKEALNKLLIFLEMKKKNRIEKQSGTRQIP
jgi:hypothetical protein